LIFPFIPKFLVSTQFDNLKKIKKTRCPLLVIHSKADEIVPFGMAELLYKSGAGPKKFLDFKDAGHNDLIWMHGRDILNGIIEFISDSPE